jgi:hypothetical protein
MNMIATSMDATPETVNPGPAPGPINGRTIIKHDKLTISVQVIDGDERALEQGLKLLQGMWGHHYARRIRLLVAFAVPALAEADAGESDLASAVA